ncbi:Bacterial non-heme ferritin [bioreactor metagenome]|uniref:Bacterial non-heme ferritin n=1 Tax=bioreactor metagenome TaxID=1076179 RepID=A0A644UWS5_9ZZZZ|nr:ferritin [Methanobrevibacter sp.]MEA4957897.1 ferritin [Methanobrevibacter sp.]
MVNAKMEEALNKQLNAELYSGYLYLSMAAYFEEIDLGGFANWMRVQAQEELSHGMRFYDYIVQRGARVTLSEIEKPQSSWESPVDVFEHVLSHEKTVSGLIDDLVDLSIEERDHSTNNFLQWFVAEQVEEEESASSALNKVKLANESSNGLFLVDSDFGTRVYTPDTSE